MAVIVAVLELFVQIGFGLDEGFENVPQPENEDQNPHELDEGFENVPPPENEDQNPFVPHPM